MNKKRLILVVNLLLLTAFFFIVVLIQQKPAEIKRVPVKHEYTSKGDNLNCFKCHASEKYMCKDTADSTKQVCKAMNPSRIIDSAAYYQSNHYDFGCTNCHSDEYSKTPHNPELKKEEMNGCLDCHGEDETYAKYHFDSIGSACKKSIHTKKMGKDFTCFSCHDAHTYKVEYRDSLKSIEEIVEYSNGMCYKCHGNVDKSNKKITEESEISKIHSWLPDQKSHFEKLRCIECHAQTSADMDVSHNILPKNKAIKECAACHNPESSKLNSLYEKRKSLVAEKLGFEHPELTKYANVIGANHNDYLNLIGLAVLGLLIFALSIHVIFRIKLRK